MSCDDVPLLSCHERVTTSCDPSLSRLFEHRRVGTRRFRMRVLSTEENVKCSFFIQMVYAATSYCDDRGKCSMCFLFERTMVTSREAQDAVASVEASRPLPSWVTALCEIIETRYERIMETKTPNVHGPRHGGINRFVYEVLLRTAAENDAHDLASMLLRHPGKLPISVSEGLGGCATTRMVRLFLDNGASVHDKEAIRSICAFNHVGSDTVLEFFLKSGAQLDDSFLFSVVLFYMKSPEAERIARRKIDLLLEAGYNVPNNARLSAKRIGWDYLDRLDRFTHDCTREKKVKRLMTSKMSKTSPLSSMSSLVHRFQRTIKNPLYQKLD